jgi:hypothetical protein
VSLPAPILEPEPEPEPEPVLDIPYIVITELDIATVIKPSVSM